MRAATIYPRRKMDELELLRVNHKTSLERYEQSVAVLQKRVAELQDAPTATTGFAATAIGRAGF